MRAWRNGRRARLRIWCLWRKSSSLFVRIFLWSRYAVVAQLVECHLAKVDVAGPNPVYRSKFCGCSSMVEPQPSKLVTWVRFPSPALWLQSRTAVRRDGCFRIRKKGTPMKQKGKKKSKKLSQQAEAMAKQIAVENALLNTLSFCMERNVLCRVLMQGEKWTQHNVWLVLQVSREFVFVLRATDFRFAGYEIHRLKSPSWIWKVFRKPFSPLLRMRTGFRLRISDLMRRAASLYAVILRSLARRRFPFVNWIQTILPGLLSPLSCPMTISMCSVSRRPTCFHWQRFPCLMMPISVP